MTKESDQEYFTVRARTEDDPAFYYYASKDGGFVKWKPGALPLHEHPIAKEIRFFPSREEAEQFARRDFSDKHFCYIGAELEGPQFQKHFTSAADKLEEAATKTAAKSGGKTKYVIGGIVAAVLGVGAVIAWCSSKGSRAEQEAERRAQAQGVGTISK